MKKTMWNKRNEPIAERLRDPHELGVIIVEKSLIYNPYIHKTAIVMDVYEVDIDPDNDADGYSEEDRYVEYVTDEGPKSDFSIDLDDEGWLWHRELKELK
tara:strand:+ start:238 stop:537 length:300 start_codon:yes stop_codon:yes gene_type:complete